jgi:flagellar protein FliL
MKRKKAEAPEAPAATGEAPAKGKRSMLIPAVVIALAVLGGGAMAGGFIGGGVSGADEAVADGEAAPTPTPTPTALGVLVELDPVTLNLAEGRFLKLAVAVELAPGVVEPPPTAPIYDEVIEVFGPMTFDQLSQAPVRSDTKTQLLDRLSTTYGEDIVGVYYTEFVMQ